MPRDPDTQQLDLAEAADLLLNECRMVLPGMQALFGFQLVAVFSQRFATIEPALRSLHLAATALVVVAIALIMTPAALHRQAGARQVSAEFIRASTRLLGASMGPLAVGLCQEFYIVASVLWPRGPAGLLGAGAAALFAGLWFVLPRVLVRRGGADARGNDAARASKVRD